MVAAAVKLFALASVAAASSDPVSVFPSPGTKYNQPQTQITFRGVAADQIGQVTVVGSVSGAHSGTIEPDSDGDGGSFVPSTPFTPGETVTVSTALSVTGGENGQFTFAIANSDTPIGYGALPLVSAVRGGLQSFHSAPGLHPPTVDVTTDKAPASQGDIFVAPQFGPEQDGPMILDPQGRLIWFLPSPVQLNQLTTDFRVQTLHGQPVLTWWQGNTNGGHGRGVGVIYNQQYQPVATVRAGNGLDIDLHEFLVTDQGDAYFLCAWRVNVPGIRKPVVDAVVQEVDIKTGLVLFEWDALDHIPLTQSYFTQNQTGSNYDPYHANSISLDTDGNLIVSMRNTSAIYKVNRETGQIMWTLGGKASTFRMGKGTRFWEQHDALVHPGEQITIFDDEGAPPRKHQNSRAIRIGLHVKQKTVNLIQKYGHTPQLPSAFEGSLQPLSNGDVFMGWGQQPYFSEDDASGRQIFDAHFAEPTGSYRAYRFQWTGQPPASQIATASAAARNGTLDIYASWNGATQVTSWRVLGGSSQTALSPIAGDAKTGFETTIAVHAKPAYYAVQALDASGQVLGTSTVEPAPVRAG
jgi:Arylsulfotransferase (ASST)